MPELTDAIERAHMLFTPIGGRWNEQKKRWVMPQGGRFQFKFLERDSDANKYQGHSYTRVYMEELTNFPMPGPVAKLKATLRSAYGIPVGFRATCNPGGPGHSHVKMRYIDPAPEGYKILTEQFVNPFTQARINLERVFIPAKLSDNKKLMDNDPLYVARLQEAGSPQLVQAWLLGLWDIIDGAFFSEFDPMRHVLPAELLNEIPSNTYIVRSYDHGYARPFCVGWYALCDGSWGSQFSIPRGAMVKIMEWYGWSGKPNEGLRIDAGPIAEGIREREQQLYDTHRLRVSYGVADPAIFVKDGGPSISELMYNAAKTIQGKADNKRVPGWQQVRNRLRGIAVLDADGRVLTRHPMLYFLETCSQTIRTLPLLQHDETDPEDLDTDGEDHAADETRYGCMSRPWVVDKPGQEQIVYPKLPGQLTFRDMLELNRRRRMQEEESSL